MITGQTVKNIYQGDGVNREFTITFEFTDASQVKFKVNGQEVTTNFSLNTVAKTLTYPTVASELDPLTSADEIEIYRDTEITQDIEFNNGGPLNADMIEYVLDKLTMIAQEVLNIAKNSGLEAGKGIDIEDGVISVKGVKVMPNGTDIDSLTEEGEYFIQLATCTSGFPSDFAITEERAGQPQYAGVSAYVKVIPTVTSATFPTAKTTQVCFLYKVDSMPSTINTFDSIYIRTFRTAEGWSGFWDNANINNKKRTIDCGISYPNIVFIPTKLYPNTTYKLGYIFSSAETKEITSLNLSGTQIPDTPYPIEFIFKTGDSFSGITATQIKGWIGSTSLDANSVYKITIANLIGTIEKITVVE